MDRYGYAYEVRERHNVPLSIAALVFVERVVGLRGQDRGLVFPGISGRYGRSRRVRVGC